MGFRSGFVLFTLATALLVGGAAQAEDRWFVSGMVDSVDEEARTIEVGGHTLHLGVRAKISLGGGISGDWDDVVDRDGEFVTALVRNGFRDSDEVLSIVLEDEVDDGEE